VNNQRGTHNYGERPNEAVMKSEAEYVNASLFSVNINEPHDAPSEQKETGPPESR